MTDKELKSLEEERSESRGKERGGMSQRTKVVLGIIGVIVVILILAFLTINVTTTAASSDGSFPYTTTYGVSFPEGETITVGNSHILVLSYENEIVTDIDGEREKLVVGEDRVLAPRLAKVTALGIPVMETEFQMTLKYKGMREDRAYFDLTVKTGSQVPDILLRHLLPAEIDARPI